MSPELIEYTLTHTHVHTMPWSVYAFKIKNGKIEQNLKVKRITVGGVSALE